jgi:hypothetical protein
MVQQVTDPGLAALQRELGSAAAPARITQPAFDYDDGHLHRLVRLVPGEHAKPTDLGEYANDLLYASEVQTDLFLYLLPTCLQALRDHLHGTGRYGAFVENLYPALAHPRVRALTSDEQRAAISDYMGRTLLDEIDDQRGLSYRGMGARPYRWVGALTTHGVLFPDIERLWTSWWSLDTVGRAVAAIQYFSCLMYANAENPVFAPWSRDKGGGPPCLWDYEGHLYEHRWLQPNVAFLARTLEPRGVEALLARAVDVLAGEPEHAVATAMLEDLPLCRETLEARCQELPRLLATVQTAGELLEWTS